MTRLFSFHYSFVTLALYGVASLVYGGFALPHAGVVLALNVVPACLVALRIRMAMDFVDVRLARIVPGGAQMAVCHRGLPLYRYADLHRAIQHKLSTHTTLGHLESFHGQATLCEVLSGDFYEEHSRKVRASTHFALDVAASTQAYFPADQYWVVDTGDGEPAVIRLLKEPSSPTATLEVACADPGLCARWADDLVSSAAEFSIYKGQSLALRFCGSVRESDGAKSDGPVDVVFRRAEAVGEDDIVMDDNVRSVLERNVIDYHLRREELVDLGLPSTKGVLLYGPPGTGKTHTCRYIADRLTGTTTIVVAGQALLYIKSVCNIARMLQPSLVILEDVDLVFSDRDTTHHGDALGELMDQLDGFSRGDKLTFLLTTNSIARIEGAIKDRPGRISQCVFVGPPNARLRKRYLTAQLKPYVTSQLDLPYLVSRTDGCSQAFIKELAARAVQVATQSRERDLKAVRLQNEDFDLALSEMAEGGRAGKSIIGFAATA